MSELKWALGGTILIVALYAGVYFAIVDQRREFQSSRVENSMRHVEYRAVAAYPIEGEAIIGFFAPIHEVDRRIRSERWADSSEDMPDRPYVCVLPAPPFFPK